MIDEEAHPFKSYIAWITFMGSMNITEAHADLFHF